MKLYKHPDFPAWDDLTDTHDFDEIIDAQHEAFDELWEQELELAESGEYRGAIVSFPVADGKAVYQVASLRPLTLYHIPYLDAYHFRYVTNFNVKQIKEEVDKQRNLRNLFKGDLS